MNKLDTQKRFLLATVLSLLVFIAYDYFFMPKTQNSPRQSATQTEQSTKQTPADSASPSSQAPTAKQSKSTQAPQSSTSLDHTLVTVNADNFRLEIDRLGRIKQVTLLESQFSDEEGAQIKLLDPNNVRPLEVRYADPDINKQAFKTPYTADVQSLRLNGSDKSVTLTQDMGETVVTKEVTFSKDGHYSVDVEVNKDQKFFITPGDKPAVAVDGFAVHGGLIRTTDEVIHTVESGDATGEETFSKAQIASAFSKYYATLFYDFDDPRTVSVIADNENPILFVSADKAFSINGYIGPKDYKKLSSIHPKLTDAIEYGFFSFIAAPVFKVLLYIHEKVGNWGWSIVILTFFIRLILFPLTHKGMTSMQKLKELSPRIKQIQEKYKGDSQKMNAHMMDFYKKNKVNPMGGCLPLILQIPVFFAIYRVLINTIELKGAEWMLWIHDLSAMDPYFILPILMGGSMWLQQKMSPNNFTDPMQKKIFEYLPVIFTLFFITFPAGLVLYWLTNNIFSIAQQWVINKQFEAKRRKHAES